MWAYLIVIAIGVLGLYYLFGFSVESSIVITLLATIVGLLIGARAKE